MSDQNIDASEDHGSEIRRPLRGRPPNAAKLSNGDDPRARAGARVAEIRAQKDGRDDDAGDEFSAPPSPDGWEYQWKVRTVHNQPQVAHMNNLLRNGWTEVPASRHPEFMPYGSSDDRVSIEHRGMVLMECPQELVTDARRKDKRAAQSLVNQKAAHIEPGKTDMLSDDPRARRLTKSFDRLPADARPMAIPD